MIDTKDILNWCFTLLALDFGVFGFLYSTYAMASFQATPSSPGRPAVTRYLRYFCRAVAVVLVVLTVLAALVSFKAAVGLATWIIISCLALLTAFAAYLAYYME